MSDTIVGTLLLGLWRVWDNVLLFGLGSSYLRRFDAFSKNEDVDLWRKRQKDEWDRLIIVLGLLATMHAAILAIIPAGPPFSYAVWLGGAGLSVCGVFVVQYFPIKSLPFPDSVIVELVTDDGLYTRTALLAAAVASPIIITLWSSVLFASGLIAYLIQIDMGPPFYKVFAFVPFGFGVLAVMATLAIGEILERRVASATVAGASHPLSRSSSG